MTPSVKGTPWMVLRSTRICVIDFGLATSTQGTKQKGEIQVEIYRAPEVCLGICALPSCILIYSYLVD